jgi:hypothetical protein
MGFEMIFQIVTLFGFSSPPKPSGRAHAETHPFSKIPIMSGKEKSRMGVKISGSGVSGSRFLPVKGDLVL